VTLPLWPSVLLLIQKEQTLRMFVIWKQRKRHFFEDIFWLKPKTIFDFQKIGTGLSNLFTKIKSYTDKKD